MSERPSDVWRRNLAKEAAALAAGRLASQEAVLTRLFPQSLLTATDQALTAFEQQVRTLDAPSDDEIMETVQSVVLDLNGVNDDHGGAGYETDERELLCTYIDQTLTEAGIDVPAVAARRNLGRWEITDQWREW
ncbi:hypothetical protein GCM10022251_50160 [Phytohabitans flavus]|uniref:Uncharacterized protein n=1 Tax=Phytohabitans flavus TaxID=1076124 RepID=A0A6F8XSA3_9ACTN|nr:hypothetical protein [Phytohabitans flavus]BCB76714.1 hypothetical protein Pflav_031240 [Phytohabitans flavus]